MPDEKKPRNLTLVIGGAKEEPKKPEAPKKPPPPDDAGPLENGLPPDCPVVPLGVGPLMRYYLDADKQLIELKSERHGRQNLVGLFGDDVAYLVKHWPRVYAKGESDTFRPEKVAEALSAACSRKGPWDSSKRVRGAGAWLSKAGNLVLHCGDGILSDGQWYPPGFIDDYVYPKLPALPRPCPHPVAAGDGGPGAYLYSLFRTWNWTRGDLDVRLLIGSVGCGMIGGALDWRPITWTTGGTGTGKSTQKRALEAIYGGALITCEDPSPAGVWQKLQHNTLPVAIDEHESEEDNRKVQAVVKLARQATNGTLILRGDANHEGREFVIRSCFSFYSVLIPPLLAQDRNRMAIISLGSLKSEAPPQLDVAKLRDVGVKLLRRVVDGWPRWAKVHAVFHGALLGERLSSRTADVYAALLASAEVIMSDHDDDLANYATSVALEIAGYLAGDLGDDSPDERRCLAHLLTALIPLETGAAKCPVGEWIRRVALGEPHADGTREAKKILASYGMKVTQYRVGEDRWPYLAIAYSHRELNKIYAGTHWAARSGTNGVWKQSLERLPHAEHAGSAIYFSGGTARAVLVPFACIFPDGDPAKAQSAYDSDAVTFLSDQ